MDLVHAVAVPAQVVEVGCPAAPVPRAMRQVHVGQPGRLGHRVRDVDPEAVDAAVQPEPQDALELGRHLGVAPS